MLSPTGSCLSLKFEKVDEFSSVRTLGNWAGEPLAEKSPFNPDEVRKCAECAAYWEQQAETQRKHLTQIAELKISTGIMSHLHMRSTRTHQSTTQNQDPEMIKSATI